MLCRLRRPRSRLQRRDAGGEPPHSGSSGNGPDHTQSVRAEARETLLRLKGSAAPRPEVRGTPVGVTPEAAALERFRNMSVSALRLRTDELAGRFLKERYLQQGPRAVRCSRGQREMVDRLRDDWRQLERSGCDLGPKAHLSYIACLCRVGWLPTAERMLHRMLKLRMPPLQRTYDAIISAHASKGGALAAWRTLALMRKEAEAGRGPPPSLRTLNCLLHALLRGGQREPAKRIFEELPDLDLTPDEVTWTTMLSHAESENDAEGYLNRMLGAGFQYNARVVGALLGAAGKWRPPGREAAERYAAQLSPEEMTLLQWNALMSVYKNAADLDGVKDVYQRMERSGHSADGRTYAVLIATCEHHVSSPGDAASRMAEGYFTTARRAGLDGAVQGVWLAMMRIYAATGDGAAARRLRQELADAGIRETAALAAYLRLAVQSRDQREPRPGGQQADPPAPARSSAAPARSSAGRQRAEEPPADRGPGRSSSPRAAAPAGETSPAASSIPKELDHMLRQL
eukprot:TRINITY_DN16663_c0_g1_i2.p1 TRINITY_DN16663_c0_g1~~TRINITY_DN16663_c0_g1_i2.p1  ORF type:complete len:515 (+),score=63.87 TRINITY_DN16663_c0_g1_i2:73-1617(+)